jgi:ferredoxin
MDRIFDEKPLEAETGYAVLHYVDEPACIGCMNCTAVARSTFAMTDEGRARVFEQHGDADEVIEEAIDSCPVNCIYPASAEQLVELENRRSTEVINHMQRFGAGTERDRRQISVSALSGIAVSAEELAERERLAYDERWSAEIARAAELGLADVELPDFDALGFGEPEIDFSGSVLEPIILESLFGSDLEYSMEIDNTPVDIEFGEPVFEDACCSKNDSDCVPTDEPCQILKLA